MSTIAAVNKFTLAQNYASFSSFLNISSCITSSTTTQIASFSSKLCKQLAKMDSETSGNLLDLFKRHMTTFIYENIYCDSVDKNQCYKNLQNIHNSFTKTVRNKHNATTRPKLSVKIINQGYHYFDISKGFFYKFFPS